MADIHIWLHALDIYCPQRSWGKVIFSEVCVKNSVHDGGCLGRRSWGKVIFSEVCVKNSVHDGGCLGRRSWGKVIFSEVCVKNSVHDGGCLGRRSWGKVIFSEVCVKNSVHDGGCLGRQTPWEQTPPGADTPGAVHAGRYGQQAGGTHPTVMHTCFCWFSIFCSHSLFSAYIFYKNAPIL